MVKGRIMTEETFNFTPKPDDVVQKGDVLVMIGQEKDLDLFCNDV
jgi:K+/H+ antiporter YhaU regulatory subunit KhtT